NPDLSKSRTRSERVPKPLQNFEIFKRPPLASRKQSAPERNQENGCVVSREASRQALKTRLGALGDTADAARLRLALTGAKASAFGWTLADDRIHWDDGLRHHAELE